VEDEKFVYANIVVCIIISNSSIRTLCFFLIFGNGFSWPKESIVNSDNKVKPKPRCCGAGIPILNDPGKVQGERLVGLFNELFDKKVIISIGVVGTGFERLTCIASVEWDSSGRYLLIDQPDEFSQFAGPAETWHLRFNFNGPDQLEYIFSTRGGELSGRNLKIPFPEYVERLQRRKDFRIIAVPGTKLLFAVDQVKGVIDLINISLGGAYGVLRKHKRQAHSSLLVTDQRLYKVGLIFPADKEVDEQLVVINRAEVRRIEHDKERRLYKYAFEFMDVDKEQKQILIQAIYHLQRQYLKNR
jgi:hypothetical protein